MGQMGQVWLWVRWSRWDSFGSGSSGTGVADGTGMVDEIRVALGAGGSCLADGDVGAGVAPCVCCVLCVLVVDFHWNPVSRPVCR